MHCHRIDRSGHLGAHNNPPSLFKVSKGKIMAPTRLVLGASELKIHCHQIDLTIWRIQLFILVVHAGVLISLSNFLFRFTIGERIA